MDFITALFYVSSFVSIFISINWLLFMTYSEPGKKSKPLPLTIAIPARNEEKNLGRCVESLLSQEYPGLKVIIVDDHSSDRTWEVARKLSRKYRNVRCVKAGKKGKANALNQALSMADTPLFGFIDADTWLEGKFLADMASEIGGRVASVVTYVKPHSNSRFLEKIQDVEYFLTSLMRAFLSRIDVFNLTPAFALYKTDVLRKAGGFDPTTLTEDLEMGMRLLSLGYRIKFFEHGLARTVVPSSISGFVRQRIRWNSGFLKVMWKYRKLVLGNFELQLFAVTLYVVGILISMVFLTKMTADYARSFYRSVLFFARTSPDIEYFIETSNFRLRPIFPISAIVFATTAAMIVYGLRKMDKSVKALEFIPYFIFYPFIQILLWAATIISMMRGDEKW